MPGTHQAVLTELLGQPIRALHPLSGGDICEAWRVHGANGQTWFAKHHPREPKGMFALEAQGLALLRATAPSVLQIPAVQVATPPSAPSAWLVLEWVPPGATTPASNTALGRGLARLHRATPPAVPAHNWLGPLRQHNHPCPTPATWPDFWWSQRLQPRLVAIAARQPLPNTLSSRLHALPRILPEVLGIDEPLSLLHGDLWSGNRLTDEHGRPHLIDPAVCVGHREVDLAMMALFGGFGADCWQAYRTEWPLLPGFEQRRAIYQLYYLLVHVELFGSGYWSGVSTALDQAGV